MKVAKIMNFTTMGFSSIYFVVHVIYIINSTTYALDNPGQTFSYLQKNVPTSLLLWSGGFMLGGLVLLGLGIATLIVSAQLPSKSRGKIPAIAFSIATISGFLIGWLSFLGSVYILVTAVGHLVAACLIRTKNDIT